MITYHCEVCGTQVDRNAFCAEHPRATINRVKHNAVHSICLIWHEGASERWRLAAEAAIQRGNAPASAKEAMMSFRVQGYMHQTIEESNELLDWAASLPGWEEGPDDDPNPISAHQREDVCYACGAEDLDPVADPSSLTEDDWRALEPLHAADCPWILGRGRHRDLSFS